MRRALGVLLDELAELAFSDVGPELDRDAVQELLMRAGLATQRPATKRDAAKCVFGVTEPGDPWRSLTPFASRLRLAARRRRAA
jgi:hypothetical protein